MNFKTARLTGVVLILFLALIILAVTSIKSFSQSVPSGFTESLVSTGWNSIEGFTFDANKRLYAWEKGGTVWTVDTNGVKAGAPFININEEVGNWRDHGLNGFALDPNYINNGYVYLFYTVDRHHLMFFGTGSYNAATNDFFSATIVRVTRYTVNNPLNPTGLVPGSRLVLVGENKKTGIPCLHESHTGGQMVFGTDGTLIISTGDGASYNVVDSGIGADTYYIQALADSIIQPKENVGAFRSQLLDSHNGKLLRIDPATGNGLPSNPYFDPLNPRSAKSRTWACGLRNPFRCVLRPGSGSLNPNDGNPGSIYVGDVGWTVWEDLHVSDGPGYNFGWPIYEGLTIHNGYNNVVTSYNQDAPNPLYPQAGCNQYFRFQQLLRQATLQHPVIWKNPCDTTQFIPVSIPKWVHDRPAVDWKHNPTQQARTGIYNGLNAAEINLNDPASPVPGPVFSGNAAVAGFWYTGDKFPSVYQGSYFQADYVGGWIKRFHFDANDDPDSVVNFGSNLGPVVWLTMNPKDECLWYVKFPSNIRKICYTAALNLPPSVEMSPDTSFGPSPHNVNFSSAGSSDPENGAITYLWNFGDGSTSNLANPSHVFTDTTGQPKKFVVKLTVTDNMGLSKTDSALVSVNNTPPVVNITSFNDGDLYSVCNGGTNLPLAAQVTDAESPDAALKYEWILYMHHNTHTHQDPADTNHVSSCVISPVGCDGEDYHYRVTLSVTDNAGLKSITEASIYPACDAPQAEFTVSSDTICKKQSVTFTDLSTNLPDTWTWLFPGGTPSISTAQNPVVIYNSAGTFDVMLVAEDCHGMDTIVKAGYIVVNSFPSATVTPAGTSQVCKGSSINLSANGGTNLAYQWKKNGNIINGAVQQNYLATEAGSYKVIVTKLTTGCSKTSQASEVDTEPDTKVTAGGPLAFCAGDSVILSAIVKPGYTYQWMKGQNDLVGETASSYIAKTTGHYKVRIITLAGCTATSGSKFVNVNCRVAGSTRMENMISDVVVYPNPAEDKVNLEFDLAGNAVTSIAIYDIIGNKVAGGSASLMLSSDRHKMKYDFSSLRNGVYYFVVKAAGESKCIRFNILKEN